jgi:hypothetical protein
VIEIIEVPKAPVHQFGECYAVAVSDESAGRLQRFFKMAPSAIGFTILTQAIDRTPEPVRLALNRVENVLYLCSVSVPVTRWPDVFNVRVINREKGAI